MSAGNAFLSAYFIIAACFVLGISFYSAGFHRGIGCAFEDIGSDDKAEECRAVADSRILRGILVAALCGVCLVIIWWRA